MDNMRSIVLATAFLLGWRSAPAVDLIHTFQKIRLTDQFWAEGACFGDFNHDGKMDVAYGPFWWEGPEFHVRHEFYPANATFKLKKENGAEETVPGLKEAWERITLTPITSSHSPTTSTGTAGRIF